MHAYVRTNLHTHMHTHTHTHIHKVGGETSESVGMDQMHVYDPFTNAWTEGMEDDGLSLIRLWKDTQRHNHAHA
jgi:hypothetical protein